MFGIKIITTKKWKKLYDSLMVDAKNKALLEFIELLKCKNKIYLSPVKITSDHVELKECIFLAENSLSITRDLWGALNFPSEKKV